VTGACDARAPVSRASNCRWENPRADDSAGHRGRRASGQKRTFTPSVAMHIHMAWLAANRAVCGTAHGMPARRRVA
jgi:hypothetical protein